MEGSESEAVFDAYNLNPQLFINEVLNAVDDMVDGAFDFCLQQASVITAGDDTGTNRSEELAQGVSSLHHLIQVVLDKRMSMWEKYCLRQCFDVPEGFVLPKAQDSSGSGPLLREGLCEAELDSQLDSLRKKLVVVGQESAELQGRIHALEKQSTMSSSYDACIAETLQLYEQNSAHEMYQELGKTASELLLKVEAAKTKSMEEEEHARIRRIYSSSQEHHFVHDQRISARLEDIQEVLSDIRSI